MIVFSIVFGRVARMPSDGIAYPIFMLAALIPWNLFANVLTRGSDSLVANSALLRKVYLPRLAVPLARVFGALFDFMISLVFLIVMLLWYHIKPTAHLLYLPLFLAICVAAATGTVLWLSSLNVRIRDIQQAVPFLAQLWFFSTPVAYPGTLVPRKWHLIFGLNPMAGVVEGFRWALLGTTSPWPWVAVASVVSTVLLVSGALFFRKMEQTFADIV
jgi:lipopolysaccharide transport system permease protein